MTTSSITGAPAGPALLRAATRSRRGRRLVAAVSVGALLSAVVAGAAQADDLYNTIDGETAAAALDVPAEQMKFAYDGDPQTTKLRLQARGDDNFAGCNANVAKGPVTFALQSSDPAVATVSPSTVQLGGCWAGTTTPTNEKVLTVTRVGTGTASITATVVTNPSGGTFDLRPATFTVEVTPPPNNDPQVFVTGFEDGAVHYKGAGDVPTPGCRYEDVEDGTNTFAPVMTRPAPQDPDGLGRRLATCTYKDSRGASVTASASWYLDDPDAPLVRYILSKTRPSNGWYRSEVALDWVVTEPESPSSLVKGADCAERVWMNTSQQGRTYTCTATSAGGTTELVSEAFNYDATAPVVTGTIQSPGVVVDGRTWYSQLPEITWDATDDMSGVLEGSLHETVPFASHEGRGMMTRQVATDIAGNTDGGSVKDINVDASAPVVEANVTSAPAYVDDATAWFKDTATVAVTATDPEVQPSEAGSGLEIDPTGEHEVTQTTDFSATATDFVGNTGTSNVVPVTIDATAPVVKVTCPSLPVIKGLPLLKATWKASDEVGGSGLSSYASGSGKLDTSRVGRQTYTAPVATDNVGHTSAPATCGYTVIYPFVGFFAPIDNFGVYNKVKAGSAVPVKFSLLGNQGTSVLSGEPVATKVACPAAMKSDVLEETAPATAKSGLKYDTKTGLYTYTWKTPATFAGTCQKLTVKLADGTSQTALFTFTK